jgi:hypothetical protein
MSEIEHFCGTVIDIHGPSLFICESGDSLYFIAKEDYFSIGDFIQLPEDKLKAKQFIHEKTNGEILLQYGFA